MFQNDDDVEGFLNNSFSRKEHANRDLFDDLRSNDDSPWEYENPDVEKSFSLRLRAPLHRKVTWLKERLPNMSMQKICQSAVEKTVDQLIAEVKRRQRA
jgi:hypothetical protein